MVAADFGHKIPNCTQVKVLGNEDHFEELENSKHNAGNPDKYFNGGKRKLKPLRRARPITAESWSDKLFVTP